MAIDRRSFNTGVSQQFQGDVGQVVGRLEAAISQRQADVNAAMSDFQADGSSEEYRAVEQRWNNAANEVRQIVTLVKTTMSQNDESAATAGSRAAAAVQAIG